MNRLWAWANRLTCRIRGHTGTIVPAWIGRFPGNTWIFEHARCRRCGERRWPIPDREMAVTHGEDDQ